MEISDSSAGENEFDPCKWSLLVYYPESRSSETSSWDSYAELISFVAIDSYLKHDGPELFYLMNGAFTLVVKEEEGIEEIPLQSDTVVIVDTWHNAYSPEGKRGVCLVIEKDGVSSEIQKIIS